MVNPYGMYNPMQMTLPRRTVDRVHGRQGAEMYSMGPDSDAIVLDENDPLMWFIQTDSAGYKTIKPYDIKPHEEAPVPDAKSLDERLNGLDDRLRALEEALR